MVKMVFDNGNEYEVSAEDLGRTLSSVKAVPEQVWMTNGVKYIERAFCKGPTGTYEPMFIVVVEQEPSVRTISYQNGFDSSSNYHGAAYKSATLSFPYIVNVFVFKVNGTKISLDRSWPLSFYRTAPLADFTDKLLVNNLPNVRIDPWNDAANNAAIGWTCYHNAPANVTTISLKKGESELSGINRITRQVLGYYWDASFTGSAGAVTAWKETAAKVPEVATVDAWAKNTRKNPAFVFDAPWVPHPNKASLGDVVKSIRTALLAVPVTNPNTLVEATIVAPDGIVTEKRLEAIAKVASGQHTIGAHLKLY